LKKKKNINISFTCNLLCEKNSTLQAIFSTRIFEKSTYIYIINMFILIIQIINTFKFNILKFILCLFSISTPRILYYLFYHDCTPHIILNIIATSFVNLRVMFIVLILIWRPTTFQCHIFHCHRTSSVFH